MSDELDPLSPPDRRKHGYVELEAKIEEHKEEVTHDLNLFKELVKKELDDFFIEMRRRLNRFFFRALIAFAIIGITSAFGILGFGLVLRKEGHTSDAIQTQRFDSFRQACLSQNDRHNETIAKLDIVLAKASKTATTAQLRQLEQSRKATVLLIDALAPYINDCTAYAQSRVKGT